MKSPRALFLGIFVLLSADAQTLKPLISFATNSVTVSESAGTVQIEIRRTRVLDTAVSVRFSTTGRPKHCVATTHVVEFAPGETNRFVLVALVNDEIVNTEEVVILTLTRIGTDSVLGESSMGLVIQDDDRITFGVKTYPKVWDETNGVQVLQAFRAGGLGKTSEVNIAVSLLSSPTATPTTFVPLNQKLTFLPGVTNLEVPVTLRRDYMAKADEQVRIQIGGSTPPNVTVRNVDSQIQFGTLPDLIEGSGTNWLTLRRVGPTNEPASADLLAYDGGAVRGRDFELPSTRVEFAAGEREQTLPLLVLDNLTQDGDRELTLLLANPVGARSVDSHMPAQLTIVDDEAVPSSVTVLEDFAAGGFDLSVASIAALPDGRLLAAGSFSKYREVDAKAVAILQADGFLDPAFTVGDGPLGGVRAAIPVNDGKFLVLGDFTAFAGAPRNRVVRLLTDGAVDPDHRLDLNSAINSWARRPDGGLWIGGFFSTVNDQPLSRLLRLSPDGTPDVAWTGWTNVLSIPSTLLALPAGGLLHDGWARFPDGTERAFVRITVDGTPDPGFGSGNFTGPSGRLALLPDQTYVSGVGVRWLETGVTDLAYRPLGQYGNVLETMPDGSLLVATGNELRRLRADGSAEPGAFATFDSPVSAVAVLPDGSVVVGGSFTTANGQLRQRIAKIRFAEPPGTTVRWHGSRFGGEEDRGPIRVPLVRRGNLDSATTVSFATRPVDATPGKDYVSAEGTVTFAPGERVKLIELTPLPDEEFEPDETLEVVLTGDAVDSTGAIATVVLQSDESKVRFGTAGTSATEGGSVRYTAVEREGGLAYPVRVGLERSGTATRFISGIPAGTDYSDFGGVQFEFPPGQSTQSFWVDFTFHDDVLFEGIETVLYRLRVPPGAAHPIGIVPEFAEHTVWLHDNDRSDGPGEILDYGAAVFPRAGGGVWLQTGLQRPPEFAAGPAALLDDGAPDPAFVLDPASGGWLLRALNDGRTVVRRLDGSPDNFTNRISRLAPGGQPDPSFTPLSFPDAQTAANDYFLQNSFAVAPDGSLAVASWGPGTKPTAQITRGIVVRRFAPDGASLASWTNRDLMGSGYVSPSSPPRTLPLPSVTFLDSGAALVLGRLQFRWQTNLIFSVRYPVRPLVRIAPDGQTDLDYFIEVSGSDRIYQVVALPGDHCLIMGDFYSVNGFLRPGLARLLADGSVDLSFDPELPPAYPKRNELSGLATGPGGHIWLCLKAGDDDYRIRVLDAAGKLVPGFVSPQFNGPMWSIAPLSDGRVVVSGSFDLIGGVPRARYAWLDATGKVLPAAPLTLNLLPPQAPGTARVRVGIRFTGPVTLETSYDLQSWLLLKTIEATPGETDIELPGSGDETGVFYRARR